MSGPVDGRSVGDARYVIDRDGDLWQSIGDGSWRCLTTASCTVLGGDLVNVCGPLTELAPVAERDSLRGVVQAVEAIRDEMRGGAHYSGTVRGYYVARRLDAALAAAAVLPQSQPKE